MQLPISHIEILIHIWLYFLLIFLFLFSILVQRRVSIVDGIAYILSLSTDDNECTRLPSPCQHGCMNTPGSFECSCNQGYTLNNDLSTCRGMNVVLLHHNFSFVPNRAEEQVLAKKCLLIMISNIA